MKEFKKPIVVGLLIGLAVCVAGWVVKMRAGPAPAGSDHLMASTTIFDLGAAPLSLLTGGMVYRAKQAFDSTAVWRLLDFGQVLLNWVLIALLTSWLFTLARPRGRGET
jgi:hypothetical protein